MAMNGITQGLLEEGCELKVLCVESDKHPLRRTQIPDEYLERTGLESVYVDLGLKVLPAFVTMLCGESYHVKRFVSNAACGGRCTASWR